MKEKIFMTIVMVMLEIIFVYMVIAMPIHYYEIIIEDIAEGVKYTTSDYVGYGAAGIMWAIAIVDVLATPFAIRNIIKD